MGNAFSVYKMETHIMKLNILKFTLFQAIPVTGHEGPMVVACRGSHIFYTIGSQMAVKIHKYSKK
jgi:hypothetical protein